MPNRSPSSCAIASSASRAVAPSGSESSEIVEREIASARRAATTSGCSSPISSANLGAVGGDEGKILGDAVVQVAGHPPPLRERRGLRHPRMDTSLGDHRRGEDQSTCQRSQAVARADLSRGDRPGHHVREGGARHQHRRHRDQPGNAICLADLAAGEARPRVEEQRRGGDHKHEQPQGARRSQPDCAIAGWVPPSSPPSPAITRLAAPSPAVITSGWRRRATSQSAEPNAATANIAATHSRPHSRAAAKYAPVAQIERRRQRSRAELDEPEG